MLRSILLGLGAVALAGALAVFTLGGPLPLVIWLAILGGMLTAGILCERARYKLHAARPPGAGWQSTAERFVDPDSGKMLTVYFRPADGERMYVEE